MDFCPIFSKNILQTVPGTYKVADWGFRSRAQVPRLLLQYLGIPYTDEFYRPDEWFRLKASQEQKLRGVQLPYLRDDDVIISEPIPMCTYLLRKHGRSDLLGRNPRDEAYVDMFLWSSCNMAMRSLCQLWNRCPNGSIDKEAVWTKTIEPNLKTLESFSLIQEWYLGYLTVVDFCIYEFSLFLMQQYGERLGAFPKLKQISQNVSSLQAIKTYQNSSRPLRQFVPAAICKKIRPP